MASMRLLEYEIWREVIGYEGYYEVSARGSVRSIARTVLRKDGKLAKYRQREITKMKVKKGYIKVKLSKDNYGKGRFLHRVVAEAFIPNTQNKPEINHKDGIKSNNDASNLEWATGQENMQHAWLNKLKVAKTGEDHGMSVLTNEQVYAARLMFSLNKATQAELSTIFKVSKSTINALIQERTYKHTA